MASLSSSGLAFIRKMEGCSLQPYLDQAGVWTIGTGHTGPEVNAASTITQEEADRLLDKDTASAVATVNRLVSVPLNQNQFDALVSFVYNVGATNFKTSTLLSLVNKGEHKAVPAQFLRWNKAGGKVSAGLIRRRKAESRLYQGL